MRYCLPPVADPRDSCSDFGELIAPEQPDYPRPHTRLNRKFTDRVFRPVSAHVAFPRSYRHAGNVSCRWALIPRMSNAQSEPLVLASRDVSRGFADAISQVKYAGRRVVVVTGGAGLRVTSPGFRSTIYMSKLDEGM